MQSEPDLPYIRADRRQQLPGETKPTRIKRETTLKIKEVF